MKFRKFIILTLLAGCFTACESIDEDERFIGPVDFVPKKNVLIEDFTGQRCLNCPKAADAVHTLQQTYGADHVISVAIHGGAMSLPNTSSMGLATPAGEEYNTRWGVDSWPKGLVDRQGGLLEFTSWSGYVIDRMQTNAKVEMGMGNNRYDAATRTASIQVDLNAVEDVNVKLQVWVVESGIVAYQIMPDGSHNTNYEHNHVFRDAVNGTWGEDISLKEGTSQTLQYTYELKEAKWVAENMSVVAFVYNDAEGVLQVIDAPILK